MIEIEGQSVGGGMGDEPMSKPTGRKVRPHIQGENRLSSFGA